jgi:hypothetical protein
MEEQQEKTLTKYACFRKIILIPVITLFPRVLEKCTCFQMDMEARTGTTLL